MKKGSAGGQKRAILQKIEATERLEQYIKNPNICLNCKKSILPKKNQKLSDVKKKKFCCHSCSTSFNNKYRNLNKKKKSIKIKNNNQILNSLQDEKIVFYYNKSKNLKEFLRQLGYKGSYGLSTLPYSLILKCNQLELDLNKFSSDFKKNILSLTKKELFEKRGYQKARSTICKHARIIYQKSNKPKKCVICNYDKHYEVSHIKAVCDFDENTLIEKINDVDNLIALCPNHHWEYDNGFLNLLN